MRSRCLICNSETNHRILSESKFNLSEESGWWEDHTYQIIQCMGCDEISFRKLYNDVSMQQNYDEDTSMQILYPPRNKHFRQLKALKETPKEIRKIYNETINSFNAELYILCSVGLRAIVEAICSDKQIDGGTIVLKDGKTKKSKKLDGKIAGLSENGFLSSENAEILHELRFLGNEAVHELSTPSIEELNLAIDIIEMVIDYIYLIKHKALNLKEKRNVRLNIE